MKAADRKEMNGYLRDIDKVIRANESLLNDKSITGVFIDENYVRNYIITLDKVRETIVNDFKNNS